MLMKASEQKKDAKPARPSAGSSGKKPPGEPQTPGEVLERIVEDMKKNGPIFNRPLKEILAEVGG